MKISLCTIPAFPSRDVMPSGARADKGLPPKLAICSLVDWMEKNGYHKDQYDFLDIDTLQPSEAYIAKYFRELKPTVIGLSGIISAFYPKLKSIAEIARRECPDAWIVLGGHMSAAANTILHKTPVDICVAGDGEIAWVKFLDYVKENGRAWDYDALKKIPGLCFHNAKGEFEFNGFGAMLAGSDLAQPDYDLLRSGLKEQPELLENLFEGGDMLMEMGEAYDNHWSHRSAYMMASKGCVAKCTFCQRATKGYRRYSTEKIEEEIVRLKTEHNVGVIKFFEENFGSDVAQAKEIAKIMKKHDMLWVTGSLRVTTFSEEDYRFFVEHNCLGGTFGLESGDAHMLKVLEKKITPEKILAAFQDCINADFTTAETIWLVGNPGDTEKSCIETGRLSGEIAYKLGVAPDKPGHIGYVIPVPGTPLYEYAQQVGVLPTDPDGEEKYLEFLWTTEAAYKLKYVNVNGAPRSEVLFWDILNRMEASRTYRNLCKKAPPPESKVRDIINAHTRQMSSKRPPREGLRATLSSGSWAMYNPVIDALPRWFIYPVVKYVNWFFNGLLRDVLRIVRGGNDPHFPIQKIPPRLTDHERSLRKTVNSARKEPESDEERNLQWLRQQQ